MSRYKAYQEYKDSGLEWLGSIPSHWEISPLKYLARFSGGGTPSKDNPDFWNGDIPWVSPKDMKVRRVVATIDNVTESAIKQSSTNLLEKGALLMVVRSGILQHSIPVAINEVPVSLNQDMKALRFADPLLSEYAYYFVTGNQSSLLLEWSKEGATVESIEHEYLAGTLFPCPPLKDRTTIIKFLDHETAKIDDLIEKQQRLIELLKEKRLSLVHYATKDVPEVRLENCARLISRPISKSSEELFTPIGIYNRGRGIFHKDESLACDLGDSDFFYIKDNDLIFSGQFAWEGAVALADSNDDGCIASHRYPILTGMDNLLSTSYLWAFFTSQRGDFLLSENSRGAAGRNRPLNMNSLMKEKIPLPKLEDQLAVSKVVYQEKIISDRVATVIATLQERRTALISAAVTGKIDVRDWQAAA